MEESGSEGWVCTAFVSVGLQDGVPVCMCARLSLCLHVYLCLCEHIELRLFPSLCSCVSWTRLL